MLNLKNNASNHHSENISGVRIIVGQQWLNTFDIEEHAYSCDSSMLHISSMFYLESIWPNAL